MDLWCHQIDKKQSPDQSIQQRPCDSPYVTSVIFANGHNIWQSVFRISTFTFNLRCPLWQLALQHGSLHNTPLFSFLKHLWLTFDDDWLNDCFFLFFLLLKKKKKKSSDSFPVSSTICRSVNATFSLTEMWFFFLSTFLLLNTDWAYLRWSLGHMWPSSLCLDRQTASLFSKRKSFFIFSLKVKENVEFLR